MSVEIEDIDLGFEDIIQSIIEDNDKEVEVGYYNDEQEDGIGLGELATIHEFGLGNPERPFMRRSFDNGVKDIFIMEQKLIGSMIDGNIDKETVMEVIGDFHKNQIQSGVVEQTLGLEANSQVTIDRKGSATPLIDTSRLINSTRSSIVKKNG